MTITDLVAPEAILPALKVNSKKQALQELAARASALTTQNERAIFEVLLQREKLGTTAVGYGVAIPHGKLPKLEKLFGLFARLERPIDFESGGRRPLEGAGPHCPAIARSGRCQETARFARCASDLFGAGAAAGNCSIGLLAYGVLIQRQQKRIHLSHSARQDACLTRCWSCCGSSQDNSCASALFNRTRLCQAVSLTSGRHA